MDPLVVAARLVAGRHGVLTRAALLKQGVSDRRLHGLLSNGRLVRLHPGVYRWEGSAPTWHQQALAAVLAADPALLSHTSAAALHELAGFRPGRLHLVVAAGHRPRPHGCQVHQLRSFGDVARTVVDGIPAVAVPVALVQVAACVSASRLEDAVDDALCRRLTTVEELGSVCRRGRPGSAQLRALLVAWSADGRPDTLSEARLLRLLLGRGLPRPTLQHPVGRYRVDLAYPDQRIAIEYDSFRWHEVRRSRAGTLARRNALEGAGWHVLVAAEADLVDGAGRIAAAVTALLRAAA